MDRPRTTIEDSIDSRQRREKSKKDKKDKSARVAIFGPTKSKKKK
jgi:hypothetical protein